VERAVRKYVILPCGPLATSLSASTKNETNNFLEQRCLVSLLSGWDHRPRIRFKRRANLVSVSFPRVRTWRGTMPFSDTGATG
jgi:hypothetical protein